MFLNKSSASALILLCAINSGMFKEIPDYIKVCQREQDTIAQCARGSIEALRPQLIRGIPELEVPGIDPFNIPELVVVSGAGPAQPFTASGKDIKVTGAGNFSIKSLSVDLDSLTVRARVRFPKLHFVGTYKLDSQFLVVQLKGQGPLTADAVKCDAELVLHGKIFDRDGSEYIKFTKLDMDINMKDYRIRLEGLFNGDKVLGEAANQLLNQNRAEFLKSTKPYVEKTVSALLLDFANRIVKDLPLEQLLPKPKKS